MNSFLAILIIIGVSFLIFLVSAIISFVPVLNPVVEVATIIMNIFFVLVLDISIGWKIFFIASFLISCCDRVSNAYSRFSGVFIINCMFPLQVVSALDKHTLPIAYITNKIYDLIPALQNSNSKAVMILGIVVFALFIISSLGGLVIESTNISSNGNNGNNT